MGARRSFRGHKFIKLITDNWVLDTTEGIGYYVETNSCGKAVRYTEAFRLHINTVNCTISFAKYIDVPVKIMVEARAVAENYMKLCDSDI